MAYCLVVDDEELVAQALCDVLADEGHEFSYAENGAAALTALETRRPDLVITDLRMPRVDGRQLVATIRKDARWRHIPVVMVTSSQMSAVELAALEIDGLVMKPWNAEHLLAVIDAALGRVLA